MEGKLGLPMFGWHRLRHTFATNYLRQGGDIVRLSMVLGHTQITTTQRYLHLLTEDLSARSEAVDSESAWIGEGGSGGSSGVFGSRLRRCE
jgi:hypothetical protein